MDEDLLGRARELLLDCTTLVSARASGRLAGRTPQWRRVDLRPVDIKAGPRLQITSYSETQAFTSNYEWDDASTAEVITSLLGDGFARWSIDTTTEHVDIRAGKRGRVAATSTPHPESVLRDTAHDHTKTRMLSPEHPIFAALDITTADGSVRARRRAKFHQVDEFLRVLDPALDAAHLRDLSRPLRIADLGCGNAYLTFAANAYLTETLTETLTHTNPELTPHVVGIDIRETSRQRNQAIAHRLGVDSTMTFIAAAIDDSSLLVDGHPPDIVMALHACDTATDDALAAAVRSGAQLLLIAPCCHHDIQRQLSAQKTSGNSSPLLRYALLRERFGDVLTDILRAEILRLLGYRVDVMEFIDSDHTPRNLMIRAIRTGAPADHQRWTAYDTLVAEWGVHPRLANVLAAELSAARVAEVDT